MRIATNTIYSAALTRLSTLQEGVVKTQNQISSGKRILTPSDDPIGAARVLDLSQGQAINAQFAANRQNIGNSLSSEETVLQNTTSLLQDVKTLSISAGDGAISNVDRKSIALELRSRFDQLVGQANTVDGTGNYLFAGFQAGTPPFSTTSNGVQYNGDQGQRFVQVGTSRQIAQSDPGDAVFTNIPATKLSASAASTANTGTGTVTPVLVTDGSQVTGHDYNINITGGGTTYDVIDVTLGTTVSVAAPYTSGAPIVFDGQQLKVSGAPATGDSFTVRPAKSQSIFKTIGDLITALETPASTPVEKANLTYSLSVANGNLDNALDTVLAVRSSVGTRLKEIDSLNTYGDDRNIQYASAIENIQGLDYAKSISDFTQQNTTLEAAQKTFVKISGLSLFSLL
jgi:flagellar hook-associated protein 3 FlgL